MTYIRRTSVSTDWRRYICLVTVCRWLLFLDAVYYVLLTLTNCLLLEHLHLLSGHNHSRSLDRHPGTLFLPCRLRDTDLTLESFHQQLKSRLFCLLLTDLLNCHDTIVTVPVECCVLKFPLLLLLLFLYRRLRPSIV